VGQHKIIECSGVKPISNFTVYEMGQVIIVGSDPRSLAVGESKWDGKASGTRKHKNFIKPMLEL